MWGRCQRLCGLPGSWQLAGRPGPGAGGGRRRSGELQQAAERHSYSQRPEGLTSPPEPPAKWELHWMRTSDSRQKRRHLRDRPQYLQKGEERTLRLCMRERTDRCVDWPLWDHILTWGAALVETGRHLGQGVSAGGGGGREKRPGSLRYLLLLQVPGSHFFADAGLQQAVGWDGAVPQQSVQTGLRWKHHALKREELDCQPLIDRRSICIISRQGQRVKPPNVWAAWWCLIGNYLEQATLVVLHLRVHLRSAFGRNGKCCAPKAVGGLHDHLEASRQHATF